MPPQLTILNQPLRSASNAPKEVQQVDPNGDYVFRFNLSPAASATHLTLPELYRQSIYDLLQIIRFYSKGQPVVVDEFAFRNDPEQRIAILPPAPRQEE